MKDLFSLRQAILATLQYFDLFDFPLTLPELEEYLYGWSAPKEAIRAEMAGMPEVAHREGFYFLRGREELAELRRERAPTAQKLWRRVERFRLFFLLCPFVRMVAVCNTLAYGNVHRGSDIDLFVVAAPGRLASVRFFMKGLTQLFGLRAHHEKKAGRFCLSFFVTGRAMNLEPLAHPFDPHLAYFVLTMKPISGAAVFQEFLRKNQSWTGRYFKRMLGVSPMAQARHPFAAALQWIFEKILNLFGGLAEGFFARYLEKRDRAHARQFPKSTGIVLRRDVFKFHERDPRAQIAEKFLQWIQPSTG